MFRCIYPDHGYRGAAVPVTVPLSLMVLFSLAMFTSAYFSYYGIRKYILKHRDSDEGKPNAIKTSIADFPKVKRGEHARANLSDQSLKTS